MKLRTRLSLTFALVVLLTVALISLLSNILMNHEFKKYMKNRVEQKTQELVTDLSGQYNAGTMLWNLDFLHTIGMYALYDGYIVKITDADNRVLWDAEDCDISACMKTMTDVTVLMRTKCPRLKGAFINRDFALTQDGAQIGTASISYYGPYFLSENDFQFLDTMNILFVVIGAFALLFSVLIGMVMSKRISEPVVKTAEAAKRMSEGDYSTRIGGRSKTKELDNLTAAVNLLAESLKRQEYLRKQLTADVSHELRTPVTSVQTHLEAMIEGIWEPTTERLAACHEEIERIGLLVGDLEELAGADSSGITLHKQPVDLSSILNKAISSFAVDIENRGLTVIIDGFAPEISADEDRIYQVVANLLSNAIKYTDPGGHIQMHLSQTKEHAVLEVEDNGIGISEDDLPFIFERFYRADKSRNRKSGGSGIGLAIVKAIVEAHGGKVEAFSSLGGGSCFKVSLPLQGGKCSVAY